MKITMTDTVSVARFADGWVCADTGINCERTLGSDCCQSRQGSQGYHYVRKCA